MRVSGQLHTYMLLRACVMGRPAEGNLAILIRPASRSHPRGTVRLASPQRTGLGPRDRWLVAGRAAIRSRAGAYRTSAASPTGSAPARNQHQLPAPGRERVQSGAGSPPFPAGGCTPGGERPYRHPARR